MKGCQIANDSRNCETRETLAPGRSCPIRRHEMKRALMAASVLAVFVSTQALAQTVGVGPAETIVIEPEQRTVIREYVVKEQVAPVRVK
jgi:hypothetical protein